MAAVPGKSVTDTGCRLRAVRASGCAFSNEEANAMRLATLLLAGLPLAVPSLASAQRLEIGVYFTYVHLERIGSTDHEVGSTSGGIGGRIVWRFLPHLDLDGEVAVHPNAGVTGYKVQGFLGAKAGVRFSRVGLFVKARPGFLYFSKDPFGPDRPGASFVDTQWAHSLEPAFDIGGVVEYYTSKGIVVRLDLADTVVRYEVRSVFVSQREPARQVAGFTTRNRQWSLGVGKRF